MLEFYIQNRKRWKDSTTTKSRRALLNGLSDDGEPSWGGSYIAALRREWNRDTVSPFNRYLRRQVGKYASDVYSDLSHRPIYRQNRYLLKEAFMREMQHEWEYCRGDDGQIEMVRNTYVPQPPLRAYDTGFEGKWFAKYLVWYPYRGGRRVVIDKGDPPITGYLYGVGWYGYYTRTEKVYSQELLLDSKGRPLFTKQEYEIRTRDGDKKRVIPVGGPLLRETVITTTRSEWRYLGSEWGWNMRAYARSEGELQRLKGMLMYGA